MKATAVQRGQHSISKSVPWIFIILKKFDCPSVSCPAFFFVKLLHSQISAIHLEGIIINRSDRKKYKIGTEVAKNPDAQSNVKLSPHMYSYIDICVL